MPGSHGVMFWVLWDQAFVPHTWWAHGKYDLNKYVDAWIVFLEPFLLECLISATVGRAGISGASPVAVAATTQPRRLSSLSRAHRS